MAARQIIRKGPSLRAAGSGAVASAESGAAPEASVALDMFADRSGAEAGVGADMVRS